jgi:uncharacterized protein HemX
MNYAELTPIIVAIVGGGGVWGYLSTRSKNNHELKIKEKDTTTDFQDNLIERVKELNEENNKLHEKVEDLQEKLMAVSVELATSKEKIKTLQRELDLYQLQIKAKGL